jgi:hypothetical protein
MTLESSERDFAAQFESFAAEGLLYPQREGSPLLEFTAGGRVLYLFDRLGPYAVRPGAARVVVHGVLEHAEVLQAQEDPAEALTVIGVSAAEGCGRVLQAGRNTWVVQARLPLVLSAFQVLPDARVGEWVTFRTVPPLHGFIVV